MLKGKELGHAIKAAYDLKVASGAISSKADIANHFGIKTPSVYDWFKKGSIAKDKLPELWSYFSDVAGPEHWGLAEWPYHAAPKAKHQQTGTPSAFTEQTDSPSTVEALGALNTTVNQLAPILRDVARSALLKWVSGEVSAEEAADTLNALIVASQTLDGDPGKTTPSPFRTKAMAPNIPPDKQTGT